MALVAEVWSEASQGFETGEEKDEEATVAPSVARRSTVMFNGTTSIASRTNIARLRQLAQQSRQEFRKEAEQANEDRVPLGSPSGSTSGGADALARLRKLAGSKGSSSRSSQVSTDNDALARLRSIVSRGSFRQGSKQGPEEVASTADDVSPGLSVRCSEPSPNASPTHAQEIATIAGGSSSCGSGLSGATCPSLGNVPFSAQQAELLHVSEGTEADPQPETVAFGDEKHDVLEPNAASWVSSGAVEAASNMNDEIVEPVTSVIRTTTPQSQGASVNCEFDEGKYAHTLMPARCDMAGVSKADTPDIKAAALTESLVECSRPGPSVYHVSGDRSQPQAHNDAVGECALEPRVDAAVAASDHSCGSRGRGWRMLQMLFEQTRQPAQPAGGGECSASCSSSPPQLPDFGRVHRATGAASPPTARDLLSPSAGRSVPLAMAKVMPAAGAVVVSGSALEVSQTPPPPLQTPPQTFQSAQFASAAGVGTSQLHHASPPSTAPPELRPTPQLSFTAAAPVRSSSLGAPPAVPHVARLSEGAVTTGHHTPIEDSHAVPSLLPAPSAEIPSTTEFVRIVPAGGTPVEQVVESGVGNKSATSASVNAPSQQGMPPVFAVLQGLWEDMYSKERWMVTGSEALSGVGQKARIELTPEGDLKFMVQGSRGFVKLRAVWPERAEWNGGQIWERCNSAQNAAKTSQLEPGVPQPPGPVTPGGPSPRPPSLGASVRSPPCRNSSAPAIAAAPSMSAPSLCSPAQGSVSPPQGPFLQEGGAPGCALQTTPVQLPGPRLEILAPQSPPLFAFPPRAAQLQEQPAPSLHGPLQQPPGLRVPHLQTPALRMPKLSPIEFASSAKVVSESPTSTPSRGTPQFDAQLHHMPPPVDASAQSVPSNLSLCGIDNAQQAEREARGEDVTNTVGQRFGQAQTATQPPVRHLPRHNDDVGVCEFPPPSSATLPPPSLATLPPPTELALPQQIGPPVAYAQPAPPLPAPLQPPPDLHAVMVERQVPVFMQPPLPSLPVAPAPVLPQMDLRSTVVEDKINSLCGLVANMQRELQSGLQEMEAEDRDEFLKPLRLSRPPWEPSMRHSGRSLAVPDPAPYDQPAPLSARSVASQRARSAPPRWPLNDSRLPGTDPRSHGTGFLPRSTFASSADSLGFMDWGMGRQAAHSSYATALMDMTHRLQPVRRANDSMGSDVGCSEFAQAECRSLGHPSFPHVPPAAAWEEVIAPPRHGSPQPRPPPMPRELQRAQAHNSPPRLPLDSCPPMSREHPSSCVYEEPCRGSWHTPPTLSRRLPNEQVHEDSSRLAMRSAPPIIPEVQRPPVYDEPPHFSVRMPPPVERELPVAHSEEALRLPLHSSMSGSAISTRVSQHIGPGVQSCPPQEQGWATLVSTPSPRMRPASPHPGPVITPHAMETMPSLPAAAPAIPERTLPPPVPWERIIPNAIPAVPPAATGPVSAPAGSGVLTAAAAAKAGFLNQPPPPPRGVLHDRPLTAPEDADRAWAQELMLTRARGSGGSQLSVATSVGPGSCAGRGVSPPIGPKAASPPASVVSASGVGCSSVGSRGDNVSVGAGSYRASPSPRQGHIRVEPLALPEGHRRASASSVPPQRRVGRRRHNSSARSRGDVVYGSSVGSPCNSDVWEQLPDTERSYPRSDAATRPAAPQGAGSGGCSQRVSHGMAADGAGSLEDSRRSHPKKQPGGGRRRHDGKGGDAGVVASASVAGGAASSVAASSATADRGGGSRCAPDSSTLPLGSSSADVGVGGSSGSLQRRRRTAL